MTLYQQRDKNIRRTWLLMAAFLAVVVAIGWWLSWYYSSPDVLYLALIFSLAVNFSAYWFSDRLVLSLARAKPIEKNEAPDLYNIVENLSIAAGLPMPKVYILPEAGLNAFATGRDSKRGSIAITRGLLEKLNRTELEGVLAHELSHINNKDTLLQTAVVVLVGLIVLVSDLFLRSRFFGWGGKSNDRENGNQAGAILAIAGLILMVLSPIIAKLIQLAISRKREFLADSSAALLTRYPEGLASALEKIAVDGKPLRFASKASAHLYIANPFGGKNRSNRLASLFSTHPPVEERIKILRSTA